MTIFLIGGLVYLVGVFTKSRKLKWLGGLPVIGLGLFLAFLVVSYKWSDWFPAPPPAYFRQVFGFAPPSDVTELRAAESHQLRSSELYLRFKASPQTIRRITNRGDERDPVVELYSSGFEPDWWQPTRTKTTVSYHGTIKSGGSAGEYEVLYYDTETQEAYYKCTDLG